MSDFKTLALSYLKHVYQKARVKSEPIYLRMTDRVTKSLWNSMMAKKLMFLDRTSSNGNLHIGTSMYEEVVCLITLLPM